MEQSRARSLLGRISPTRWMRHDWDRRARENAQHFIACGHSETDTTFWESGRKDLEEAVLRDVDLASDSSALEIGCGMGRLLRPLSERVTKAFGTDISNEMIERARNALADRPNVEVFVTRGDLAPVPDAPLDFIFSFIVFQHIPTKKAISRYIREAARTLADGGVFRFQVDGRPRPRHGRTDTWLGVWYEPGDLVQELRRAGFETVGIWGEHTHYLWVTARRTGDSGRRTTRAVRPRRRAWSPDAVRALVARMGLGPEEATSIMLGTRCLRELAETFLDTEATSQPERFVRHAYETFLGREADSGGLEFYAGEISAGIARSNTVDCLIASSELEEQLRPRLPVE